MQEEKNLLKYSNIFSKRLPGTYILFSILLLESIVIGMASVALLHYKDLSALYSYILTSGTLAGLIAILLPTILTVVLMKMIRSKIGIKHLLFIAMIGSISYSVFILLSSILFIFFGIGIASIAILVGDASIFGWWFFMNKIVLGLKRKTVPVALIHPTLNVILFIAASGFIFRFATPFKFLIIKLYAGIFIFMIVGFILLYMFDRPFKKSLGVGGVDVFAGMLQNWLFDVNLASPFSAKLGIKEDVETNTIVLKRNNKSIKCVFFIPEIHFGPAGTLGASNFPYILEKYANKKYNSGAFIMHTAVTAERNPVSSSQVGKIRYALDNGVRGTRENGNGMSYSFGKSGSSNVAKISLGKVSIVTFSRAPYVTEDIAGDAASLFKRTLKAKYGESILIDAHNSRYESASDAELEGIKHGSRFMKEYMEAIEKIKTMHKSKSIRVGTGKIEIYEKTGKPKDLGMGNLNVAVFSFNGFRHAMIQFNSNNILPSLRGEIISHVRKRFGIGSEVYTTDTHFVNSIEHTVENVLGRYTKFRKIAPLLDIAMESALYSIEPVKVYHKTVVVKRFSIWGPAPGEHLVKITNSVVAKARILSPIIILSGFIAAAWIISLV